MSSPGLETACTLLRSRPFVALTGAGVSTDSGIPDYRGPQAPARTPMTYQQFRSGPRARQRYWARSHVGWSRMSRALPNPGHLALARLEVAGAVRAVITQNVDGLHEDAGSRNVCALHGRIADVTCLDCGERTSRSMLQERLSALNPDWTQRHASAVVRPDGDVELDGTDDFLVPACARCGGLLKPDVVFFGENVPKDRVQRCFANVEALADSGGALLVLGSSLTVLSGFRFVRHAARLDVPVVIVNHGATRGDDLATYTFDLGTTPFLTELSDQVMSRRVEMRTPRTANTVA